jgi:hypothetical protein
VLGLKWLHDEKATLEFGTEYTFTLMDVTVVETHAVDEQPKNSLLSSRQDHKLMKKSIRA